LRLRAARPAWARKDAIIMGETLGREDQNLPPDKVLGAARKQWQAALGELELQMTRATFDTWLRGTEVIDCQGDVLTVYVRHAYAVDWLQNRLLPVIKGTLQRHAGPNVQVVFTACRPDSGDVFTFVPEQVHEEPDAPGKPVPGGNGHAPCVLNPRYTFDNFVVAPSNRLAHSASVAVAENPAHAYNPLFIYGGAGLGKTHLLHALGHEAQKRGLSVLYVSSEVFTNDLVSAIRGQRTRRFRAKYRGNDLLLLDDVQFFIGKERTQEEFFHTFNALHSTGKQIVLSCDRPPRALSALEDRLRSRLGWGLIVDVQPPEFETRMAILKAKAEDLGIHAGDEVLAFVARKAPGNVRELEGAFNCVVAHSRLVQAPLDLDLAHGALDRILARSAVPSPERVLSAVAKHYGLDEEDLTGRSRRRQVSVPRQMCMYLIREVTDTSLPKIGELLGGRDHTTVLHGCEKISAQIESDDNLRRDWLAIKEKLSDSKV
jgi:chromosomal replication initiator protein